MSRARCGIVLACFLASSLTVPALAGARYATADGGSERRSDAYREGQRALERENWDEASRIYAKAYADWKRMQKKDAIEGLRKLYSSYPKSAWIDDAKALELEMREGQPAA